LNLSIPIKDYSFSLFKSDFFAALTVVIMIIPQGMAYAVLTGVPPIYGLYAALIPLLIYPLFGSSPFLSVGPVAIVSILIATGLSQIAEPMTSEYIQLAILVSLIAGLLQLVMAGLKVGFLINFLSHPVLSGFTSAAAVIIIISQLTNALGISLDRFSNIFQTIIELWKNLSEASVLSVGLFIGTLLGILIIKKIKKSFPAALIFIVVSSLVVYFLNLETEIKIIGDIPSGLPHFRYERDHYSLASLYHCFIYQFCRIIGNRKITCC